MKAQKFFFSILMMMILSIGGGYFSYLRPAQTGNIETQSAIEQLMQKFNKASSAIQTLDDVQQNLDNELFNFTQIKNKFVTDNNLSKFTLALNKLVKAHQLKMLEFSPQLKNLLQDTAKGNIKTMKVLLRVQGDYIKIGQFMEDWQNLPAHIIPQEIYLVQENHQKPLSAKIIADLYLLEED